MKEEQTSSSLFRHAELVSASGEEIPKQIRNDAAG